jgi:hypothetical protein
MSNAVTPESLDIMGTWRLLSVEDIVDGKVADPYYNGKKPNGYIHYLPGNRMAAVIAYGERTKMSKGRTDSPADEVIKSSVTFNAYAGSFTRNGATLIHHVQVNSYENDVGTDYVRYITLDGNNMVLSSPDVPVNGHMRHVRLTWEKIA